MYLKHVKPVFGDMTLAQVANDRDGVMDLLAVKMKHLGNTARQQARYVIVATLDEAVKAGKLKRHRLDGIELADHSGAPVRTSSSLRTSKSGPSHDGGINPETKRAVGGRGTVRLAHAWLRASHRRGARGGQRGTHRGRHRLAGWRWTGRETARGGEPLKRVWAGEYRDVPVPSWLWEMVGDMPDGPLIPGNGRLFQRSGPILFRVRHTG